MAFSIGPSEKFLKLRALGVAAGVGILFALLLHTGAMRNLEAVTYDARCRMSPAPELADPEVIIIALNESSLESMDWLGWPWPREIWADLAGFLADQGAKALFFDITFETSSMYGTLEDSLFGAQASRLPTVFILNLFLDSAAAPIPDNALIHLETVSQQGPLYPSARFPVTEIAAGATAFASPLVQADPDGVVRRVPLFFRTPEGIIPSPGFALALIASGETPSIADGRLHLGGGSVPVSDDGIFIPRFMGPRGTYTTLGADEVFEMMMEGDAGSVFDDAVVLVGYTAVDLFDLKPTPFSANYPGVEVHATVYDNLMTGRGIERPAPLVPIAVTILLALAIGTVMLVVPSVGGSIAAGAVLIVGYSGAVFVLFKNGVWMDAAAPLSAGVIALLSGAIEASFRANRQKRFLRSAFGQYLSPEVVAQVVKDPSVLTLGGERRVMTAFFSDVQGFTSISEKLEPEGLVTLLNHYLTAMTDIILKWGGTVDKFEGDAIVAFWGAPVPMTDHAERACRAAMECQAAHKALNEQIEKLGFPRLITRIGLSTGPMVVGNMGSEKRFDYTIMGDSVNLASRLEGVNKVYGTRLLVSGSTREAAPAIQFLMLDSVRVVGQTKPVALYTPFEALPDWSASYEQALATYASGDFAGALPMFRAIDFPAAANMAARCENMLREGPPLQWDGVWNLSSK
ncbi:MAG: adenylate/guanylate cyclase domain-containing protein [Candidatus Fermentibacteraceae bacterium]